MSINPGKLPIVNPLQCHQQVSSLPADCGELELREHFSALYSLAAVDWRRRGAVEDTRPVEEVVGGGSCACGAARECGVILAVPHLHLLTHFICVK